MFYSFDLTIPANTTELAPVEEDVELVAGLVHHVELQFPRGCVGLVHVRVFHALHQLWPANPDGDLSGENALIGWNEEWELEREPLALTLQGWNLDDSYAHTITFRFALREAKGGASALPALQPAAAGLPTLELP